MPIRLDRSAKAYDERMRRFKPLNIDYKLSKCGDDLTAPSLETTQINHVGLKCAFRSMLSELLFNCEDRFIPLNELVSCRTLDPNSQKKVIGKIRSL